MASTLLTDAQAAYARGEHARVLALLRPHADVLGAQGLVLLGNSALAAGDEALAFAAFTRLHARQPGLAPVARALAGLHNKRGVLHRRARRAAPARADFERALHLDPAHPEAGYNLALLLATLGESAAAAARLDAHLAHHPDDDDARWLALEWLARTDPVHAASRACELLERIVEDDPAHVAARVAGTREGLAPGAPAQAASRVAAARPDATGAPSATTGTTADADTLARLADTLRNGAQLEAAARLDEHAYRSMQRGATSPGLRHALSARLAQPQVMASREAIATQREAFAQAVAGLEEEWTPAHLAGCEPALEQLAWSNFYLAYHGENDRALQAAYGNLIARAASALAPAPAPFTPPPRSAHAPRVGLLSSSFRDCTAGAYFGGWVDWLREAGIETFVYQLGPRRDAVTASFEQRASRFHYHDGALAELAHRVRSDGLDLLVYPELGMDARLLPLAALRLAPRQAMGWGHPVTSGLPTMDAYLTCAAMEPPGAEAHYTETLYPLPGLGVEYARPPLPAPATREALGLPAGPPLVLYPQSLFKLHPDDDAVLDALLHRVPAARIVMFRDPSPYWQQRYFDRVPARVAAAIHWLAPMDRAGYLQVNLACDLMLDTLRWSGGNTSLDALACGLPLLTCPGATMRARQSAAMLGALGLSRELVAAGPDDLVPRAAALLADAGARATLSARIGEGLPTLFAADAARDAFLEAIRTLCTNA